MVPSRVLRFGEFLLNLDRGSLQKGVDERKLRPKSFDVLRYLAEHPRRLLTKQELMTAIWPDAFVTDNALVQCLQDVRRALDDDGQQLIRTVSRRGYIFEADVEPGMPTDPPPIVRPIAREGRSRSTVVWLALLAFSVAGLLAGSYRLVRQTGGTRIETLAVSRFSASAVTATSTWNSVFLTRSSRG